VRWVERLLARLSLHVPGESPVLWVIGIGLVLLVALLLGMRSIHRRTRVSNGVAKLHGVGLIDPLELERMATKAESESRFDDAVRLLYVAGIVRLNRAGTIVLTDSLTTHQIETQVGPGPFVELTRTFERVLYGNDEATKMDVAEARAGWTRLLSSDRAA
jgi:hypothetical protein